MRNEQPLQEASHLSDQFGLVGSGFLPDSEKIPLQRKNNQVRLPRASADQMIELAESDRFADRLRAHRQGPAQRLQHREHAGGVEQLVGTAQRRIGEAAVARFAALPAPLLAVAADAEIDPGAAQVGADRVRIQTEDDEAAIAALAGRFGLDATMSEGAVAFFVPSGEEFVPRLFARFSVPIRAVSVSRPSLDDVFMSYTGKTIRDAEATGTDAMRQMAARFRGRR